MTSLLPAWLTLVPVAVIAHGLLFASYIALQRRKPTATLAWILLVALLPGIGLGIWLLLGGRRIRRQRKLRRAAAEAMRPRWSTHSGSGLGEPVHEGLVHDVADVPRETPPLACDMMQLGQAQGLGGGVWRHNRTTLFLKPADLYDALVEAIGEATDHVHLEYYIYRGDHAGTRIRDALIERAQAGVKVRCLFDGLGCIGLNDAFLAPLKTAGVEVEWFLPLRIPSLSREGPWFSHLRNHRKIVVLDGRVAFTGGVNVGDEYAGSPDPEGPPGWRDTHLCLEGPVVRALQEIFLEDWAYATQADPPLDGLFPDLQRCLPIRPGRAPDDIVQIIASGPDEDWDLIHKLYFQAIAGARRRVWLTTPYFVPDPAIHTALIASALRGVDVQLLLPHRSDVRLAEWAARSYYRELLEAGVRIYEYLPSTLHAKTLVVDGEIASVGSANMDIRSFELNFEANAFIYCEHVACALETAFRADLEQSVQIEVSAFVGRAFRARLAEGWARLLSPIL